MFVFLLAIAVDEQNAKHLFLYNPSDIKTEKQNVHVDVLL